MNETNSSGPFKCSVNLWPLKTGPPPSLLTFYDKNIQQSQPAISISESKVFNTDKTPVVDWRLKDICI